MEQLPVTYDVAVIGAGIAGLAAARVCAEAGLSVVVLEASKRVGGRIRTLRANNEIIELGAEFVHGQAPELVALIAEAGLTTYERTGDFLVRADGEFHPMDDEDDTVFEGLEQYAGQDRSFAEYLDGLDLSAEDRQAEIGYVEGFNAADARQISILSLGRQQAAEDAIDGGRSWRVAEGYDRIPDYVASRVKAAGGEIVFQAWVTEVSWGAWGVEAGDRTGRRWKAERAIIALPLSVLQPALPVFDRLRFLPEPSAVLAAAGQMRMGDAVRVTIVFRKRLWPEGMSFLLTPGLAFRVWWTAHPAESLSLTAWVGGPKASAMLDGRPEQASAEVAAALGLAEEVVAREIAEVYTYDWRQDATAQGAYSWVAVGGAEASAVMSQPVDERLYFAGEHTDTTGHWGTVHGALRSGLRAGAQVLADFRGSDQNPH
jgi:monoamine oxidase